MPQTTIWADPRLVEDPAAAGQRPRRGAGDDARGDAPRSSPGSSNTSEFEYVARQVDDTAAEAVKALGLKGVYQYAEHKRFYPSEESGRSVLGSTDPDGNGTAGLELQYDEELTGEPGELIRERDQQGRTIPTGRRQVIPAEPGDDLRLTLDRTLQYEAEQYLLARSPQTQARGGMVLVMDTATGDLLAMANVRVDDAGRPELAAANLAAVDMYELGSVNKIDHRGRGHRGGHGRPQHALRGALPLPVRRPRVHRRRAPRGHRLDARRHRREVLERRHDQGGRDPRKRPSRQVPAGLRLRRA